MTATSANPGALGADRTRKADTSVVTDVQPAFDHIAATPIDSISVLIPVMNEEGNLPELHSRLVEVLDTMGKPWEIVFVDDGSRDATWSLIRKLRTQDPRVVGIRHRRNFGKAEALMNGFQVCRGDLIVTMDGDLQDDPTELPNFLEMIEDGYDLVSGWKQRRQDPLGKTAPSKVFNWTVRKSSGVNLHDFNCGFKAYRREAALSIDLYGELHRFTPVLANSEGFRIGELPVKHHARKWGSSKYGWERLTKGFLDLLTVVFLTRYRQRPMHLFGLPGLVSLALGVLLGLWLTFEKLVLDERIGTRPALLLSVLLVVLGAQFFGLGLIGEFMTHTSNSAKLDRRFQLRETIGLETAPLATVDHSA